MTPEPEPRDDLSAALEQLGLYVVALEREMARTAPPRGGVTDTPGLGVLMALEVFGPLRPSTLAELLNMLSGTTSKRIERLERASLLGRRLGAVPEDRRGVMVEIREEGRLELRRVEQLAGATGGGLLRVLQRLLLAPPAPSAESADAQAYPVLAALFRFVSLIDQIVIRAVDDHEVLHPSDPRPLLLLVDLDRNGPRAPGRLPELLDRSRTATHRLVSLMTHAGLIGSTAPTPSSGRPLIRVSDSGQRVLRSVIGALDEELPSLQPAIGDLARSLTDAASLPHRE